MEKCVILSVKAKWCKKIAIGEKAVEARKTYPKTGTPFKVYLYCTMGEWPLWYSEYRVRDVDTVDDTDFMANGKVIGEFNCNQICHVLAHPSIFAGKPLFFERAIQGACLTEAEVEAYGGGKDVVGWVISNLKIYDKPKTLAEFGLSRAPQSWCYVKEVAV